MSRECEVEGGGQVNVGVFILAGPLSFSYVLFSGLSAAAEGSYCTQGGAIRTIPFCFRHILYRSLINFFYFFFPGVVILVQTSTSWKEAKIDLLLQTVFVCVSESASRKS